MNFTNQMIKKGTAFMLTVLLLVFPFALSFNAYAAQEVPKETVRVGYFQADGYQEMNEDETRYGYGFDFLQMMLRYNDWKYEYVGFDKNWGDMLAMLDSGEIDMLTLVNKTDERLELYDYSAKPIGVSSTIMTVSSNNTEITAGNYTGFENARVGLVSGSSHNEGFEAYAEEKGFNYTPVYYDSINKLLLDLRDGKSIDVAVTSNMRTIENETIIDEFNANDYYAIVLKGNASLLSEINSGISQLDIDSPDWRNTLYQNYYANNKGENVFLSASEKEYIASLQQSGKVIKAAMNPELAPYSYFENGEAKGFAPEIFKVIAEKLGIKYEILHSEDRWEYKDQIQSGEAEIDLTAYLDYSIAQKYGLMETDAYMETTLAMMCRPDSDLNDSSMTVAIVGDNTEYAGYNNELLMQKSCVEYDSLAECINAVKSGKADVTYCYAYSAQLICEQDYTSRLQYRIMNDFSFGLSVGVNNNADHRLLSVLNKGVNIISAQQRQSILLQESANAEESQGFAAFLYTHPVEVIIVIILLLAVLSFAVILINKNKSQKALLTEKSEFLARMSHDMRTPMNVILGLSAMTIDEAENPVTVRDNMGKMRTASDFLLGLVNDVLDMTKMEQREIHLHEEPYAYSDFVSIMKMMFQGECDRKGITLEIQTPDKNPSVLTDKTRLNQIFFNLFSNAVKYTGEGGRISFTYSNLKVENDRMYCDYELRDNGIGMSEEFQKRMFEPFAQEDSRVTPELQGSGLGLSISKNLIDLMGGSIRIESKKGVGTTVFVHMSYPLVTMNENKKLGQDAARLQYKRFIGRCVLLAEDHPLNAQIARKLLEKMGITVIYAENGKIAVDKFKGSPENCIDAVLMDIRMPEMNGHEATRAIRALARQDAAEVPIIALSANAYDVDVKQSLKAGMNEHLAKPVDPVLLCSTLAKYFTDDGENTESEIKISWQEVAESEFSVTDGDSLLRKLEDMGAEVEDTLKRLTGEKEKYLEYLNGLENDKNIIALREAVEEKDYERAEKAVHTLKGVALNLGLVPLVDVCMDMLLDFREGKQEEACSHLQSVEKCYNEWVAAIQEGEK